jgi:hypothetical protein
MNTDDSRFGLDVAICSSTEHRLGRQIAVASVQMSRIRDILSPTSIRHADNQLSLPTEVDGVTFSGKMPNWLASYLTLRAVQLRWVALQYPQYQPPATCARSAVASQAAVVVHSRHDGPGVGAVVSWNEGTCWLVQESIAQPTALPIEPLLQFSWSDRQGYRIVFCTIVENHGQLDCHKLAWLRLPVPVDVPNSSDGLVLAGPGPIWMYAALTVQAAKAWPWVALYNPRTPGPRSVVVHATPGGPLLGSLIPPESEPADRIPLGDTVLADQPLARAGLAVIGPAKAGKSVLCHAMSRLLRTEPGMWMFDATPDAEGHWYQQVSDPQVAAQLREAARSSTPALSADSASRWSDEYTTYVVDQVAAQRERANLLIVGTGGMPSQATQLLVSQCRNALILLRDDTTDDEAQQWQDLCRRASATLLGVVRSDLSAVESRITLDSDGMLRGTVARLKRHDPTAVERCRCLAGAILRCLADNHPDFSALFPRFAADTMTQSDRFVRAVALACELHRHQTRKGTAIPYVSHLLAVAA